MIVNLSTSSPNNPAVPPIIRSVTPSSATHSSAIGLPRPASRASLKPTVNVWLFTSLVCYLTICCFGLYLEVYREGYGLQLAIRNTLLLGLPSFILLYLPLFWWGKRLKAAPWPAAVTSLVFAAWGCAPIFLIMFASAVMNGLPAMERWYTRDRSEPGEDLVLMTWRMLLTSVLASALVGLFWHKAFRGKWSVQSELPVDARQLRVTTVFLTSVFAIFAGFVFYFYFH